MTIIWDRRYIQFGSDETTMQLVMHMKYAVDKHNAEGRPPSGSKA